MANTKISALTAATTPVAGTEVLPIVQSSTTKQVSIANLTAGRSVSAADYVMSTGNLVPSTAAKGINFTANTPASGMTSQLLNWYEEGTFTPTWNGGTVTVGFSKYTRIGRQVNWIFDLTFGVTVVVATSTLTLPFACVDAYGAGSINYTDIGAALFVNLDGASDTLQFRAVANGASISCATVATKRIIGIAIYNA